MTAFLQLVAVLLPFLLDWWQGRQRPEVKTDERIDWARKALAKDDGAGFDAAAADQHDRVQRAIRGG
jgi:hypothetical protein